MVKTKRTGQIAHMPDVSATLGATPIGTNGDRAPSGDGLHVAEAVAQPMGDNAVRNARSPSTANAGAWRVSMWMIGVRRNGNCARCPRPFDFCRIDLMSPSSHEHTPWFSGGRSRLFGVGVFVKILTTMFAFAFAGGTFAQPALAQPPPPTMATVITIAAPVFSSADDQQTPIGVAAIGSVLRVIETIEGCTGQFR